MSKIPSSHPAAPKIRAIAYRPTVKVPADPKQPTLTPEGHGHCSDDDDSFHLNHGVVIPGDDRFVPFALTIRVGDTVTFTNNDTDEHTVVSNDAVNSVGPFGINEVLPSGSSLKFTFNFPGQWNYYCRIHSALDVYSQPMALDVSTDNGKLPMSGSIAILPN